MILPCASRWTISIGWMTRQRTRTTSPAFTLDGTRMRILPMSLIPQPPQPPTVTFTSRFAVSSVPSLCSTMARTSVVSPRRTLAPTNAWPASGVSVAFAMMGMRFLSATIQMLFTWEAGVIGALTSTLTGTTAPFSAMGGMSSLISAAPSFIGRPPNTRLSPSCTDSCRPSAWDCPWAWARAGVPMLSVPVASAAPTAPRVPRAERRVIAPAMRALLVLYFYYDSQLLLRLQPERGRVGLEGARQPQRPAQIARARRRPRQRQPLAIDLERLVGVHEDVAIALVGAGPRHAHLLVPAVLAADRIRLDREREVLVHTGVLPPDARGVGSGALDRLDAVQLPLPPLAGRLAREIDERGGPPLAARRLGQPPAPEVVRARDDARADGLGHPDLVDEPADGRRDLEQLAGRHAEARGVLRMQPERVRVRDLVEPLGVARACVDQRGQPDRRQQHHLALRAVDVRPVDVAADVAGHRVLGPLPVLERLAEELQLARGRREADARDAVDDDAVVLGALVGAVDVVLDEKCAVRAHVGERREGVLLRRLRQPRHAVLEDPAVDLLDAHLGTGAIGRFEIFSDPERTIRIDAPGELDPELVLLPDLTKPGRLVRLPREVERLAALLERHPEHRLTEADPACRVSLLRHEIVTLGGVAHRQHVVGEPRRLAPHRRQTHVALDLRLVGQHLDPGHPVGVGPHGVVDAREVHGELAAALTEKMREQERHLEERQRILPRHQRLAPPLAGRRHQGRRGDRLVPRARRRPPRRGHGAHQHHEQLERARHLPAAEIARRGVAPDVGGQRSARGPDRARDLDDRGRRHPALLRRELRRVRRVQLLERRVERVEGHRQVGPLLAQVLLPVRPLLDERAVVAALGDQDARHRQQDRGFGARPRREPVVGHRGGVGQARVDDGDFRAAHLGLDDPLRVRVEVVTALEVRGEQQDEARVGVIRRGPVHAVPERVAGARARRADVGVAVVAVDPPRVEHALQVDELVSGTAEVIHDFLLPALDERLADPSRDVVERVVPRYALPSTAAARPLAAHRIEDALGILHLIEGGGTLGAVAAAAARMHRVALELLDLQRVLVDVREEAARRLAVEADGRDQLVAPRDLLRPRDGIELLPVVPALDGRIRGQPALARREVAGDGMQRLGDRPIHLSPSLPRAERGDAAGGGGAVFDHANRRHTAPVNEHRFTAGTDAIPETRVSHGPAAPRDATTLNSVGSTGRL